ncbi:hypothetical protein NHQ30_001065 [Ciborinia camelliae]|nr:hypothetical protein NHQ30_001065 [Ciborinia camelliae]
MTFMFGIGIEKSFMLLLVYAILLVPLLSFTNAEVGHNPAALPIYHLAAHDSQDAKIYVENLIPSTTPSVNHHHHAYNISARADPVAYAQRMTKGRQLACAMKDSLALTTQKNGGTSQEADIFDPANLYSEGYRNYINQFGDEEPYFEDHLNEMMTFIGMPLFVEGVPGPPYMVRGQNSATGTSMIDGLDIGAKMRSAKKTQPTDAMWQNMINCNPGVIIADYNESPTGLNEGIDRSGTYTRIWTWSDAAFLYYKRACGSAGFANLQWVVRAGIVNQDTNTMVKMALRASGYTQIPPWGGRVTLHPTDDPFYAILGCKNGAGVAYMLTTHKDAVNGMGVKEILSVTIWNYNDTPQDISNPNDDTRNMQLCLLFQIAPVNAPNPPV